MSVWPHGHWFPGPEACNHLLHGMSPSDSAQHDGFAEFLHPEADNAVTFWPRDTPWPGAQPRRSTSCWCGPRSIGLTLCNLLGVSFRCTLMGVSFRAPRGCLLLCTTWVSPFVHLLGVKPRECRTLRAPAFVASLAEASLGLMNQMNVVMINLHSWPQSSLISFHSLTHFASLINKLLHSKE